ncbi:MAG TPA: PqqD family protein, partial [Williamwhitmania sp.]|nr:PqqD family protein [Williamwhitmania sp.]
MIVKANIALSDNGFVFNPATGDSFTLNETGKVVLTLIKDGKSLKQITNFMKEEYDVDEVTLDRYLADFVNDL